MHRAALHRAEDLEAAILRELLAHDGEFVSGAALAREAGVSRVAIWAHLRRLREQGFSFEAVPSRGYRMTGRPAVFSQRLVRALLRGPAAQTDLVYLPSIDSTNEEAERQLTAGRRAPFAVLAGSQTQGRGRFGRTWHSPEDGNLYVSFAFRPHLAPGRMHLFTLWMGLNLCEVLNAFCRLAPGLKWPNDLYYGDRKVGGMLTEARIDSDQIRDLIFGLGLNVNGATERWPREVQQRATTLAQVTGHSIDLNQLAAAIIGRVLHAYEEFTATGAPGHFADLWHRYDVLAGRRITVVQGEQATTGTARGIDDEGSLVLRTEQGRTLRFRAGEVTIQKT